MGTGYTSFPAASTSSTPQTYFYVTDPADSTHEIVMVTVTSGTSWTVTRGALGTTAVAHASGATWVQVTSHGTFQNFKQTPAAVSSAVTVANTSSELVLASYLPTSDELVAGATWDAVAYGTFGVLATGTRPTLQFTLYWGGSGSVGGAFTSTGSVALAQILTGSNTATLLTTIVSGASWDIQADVTWLSSTTATANLNLWLMNVGSLTTAPVLSSTVNTTANASSSTPKTISGNGPLILTAKWSAASASNTLTATAPLIRRAA
jgi:hypothetical protein